MLPIKMKKEQGVFKARMISSGYCGVGHTEKEAMKNLIESNLNKKTIKENIA